MDVPGRRHGGRGALATRLLRHGRRDRRGGSQEWESGEPGGVGMVGYEEERGEARGRGALGRDRRGFLTRVLGRESTNGRACWREGAAKRCLAGLGPGYQLSLTHHPTIT